MIQALGDGALIARFGEAIDAQVVARVQAVAQRLRASAPAQVVDIVPAYASIAVFAAPDAAATDAALLGRLERWFAECIDSACATQAPSRVVEIPVRYDGADLAHIAAHTGLDADEVVHRHACGQYTVAMLGFAPGFPYLLGLDPALATPRRAQPRTQVAAGSVGIGGAQTGIYPRASPGGWQILGHTPLSLFDAARPEPSLLQPGDRVRLVPVR